MDKEIFLCQFEGFSCFGCCGREYAQKEIIEQELKEQAALLEKEGPEKLSKQTELLNTSGICNKLVLKNGKVFCGCHPIQNKGVDYRVNDKACQRDFFCETMKWFRSIDKQTRDKFLQFLRQKDLNWYTYSINMDNGNLKKEFEINNQ